MRGVYIHIPFCAAICNYCNFNRGLIDDRLKTRYLGALLEEIVHAGRSGGAATGATGWRGGVDSIYFGGGTPSLLTGDEVAALIGACRSTFEVTGDAEVTLEANPETVSLETLTSYRHAGVTRLSIGVQSLRDDELRRLSRLHSAARARTTMEEARCAGFDNVSLDFMMWLPGQAVEQWLESVEGAIALSPDHVSLYMLEVYPNAPLKDEMARSAWSQAPDDDVAAMYTAGMERLEGAGYAQYEISNVARPGRQSRHNLKYWRDGEWFGFGCGAHSTLDGVRRKNVSGTEDYIDLVGRGRSPAVEERRLTGDERLGEALFTGLRLLDGVDVAEVNRRYATNIWHRYGPDLQPFVDLGLLDATPANWRLTRQGLLLAHEVMAVFV